MGVSRPVVTTFVCDEVWEDAGTSLTSKLFDPIVAPDGMDQKMGCMRCPKTCCSFWLSATRFCSLIGGLTLVRDTKESQVVSTAA